MDMYALTAYNLCSLNNSARTPGGAIPCGPGPTINDISAFYSKLSLREFLRPAFTVLPAAKSRLIFLGAAPVL